MKILIGFTSILTIVALFFAGFFFWVNYQANEFEKSNITVSNQATSPRLEPTSTPTPIQTDTNSAPPQPDQKTANMYFANQCAIQAYRAYMNGVTQLIGQGYYNNYAAQLAYKTYFNGRTGCYTELGLDPNSSTVPVEPMYPPTN